MKTIVYVDGFNLYYGAVKGTPYRWLTLSLCWPDLRRPYGDSETANAIAQMPELP